MLDLGRFLFLLAVISLATQSAKSQRAASPKWSPATYHGLRIGISTRKDVINHLGKPKTIGKEQDTGFPIVTYVVSDPAPGVLTVYFKKGVLDGMTLSLRDSFRREDIVRLFGPDYITVRYDTDDCRTEGGTAPIYESPNGPIQHLEYREKGIGVILQDGKAKAIAYVARPFGPAHSVCAKHGSSR